MTTGMRVFSNKRIIATVLLSIISLAGGSVACAESLESALSAAYRNNPDLDALRAGQRAVDETVTQAKAPGRPQIGASATYRRSWLERANAETEGQSARISLNASQALFRGGQIKNSILKAEQNVLANRASIIAQTQSILMDAANAYMNVVRSEALVQLNQQSVNFFKEQQRLQQQNVALGTALRVDLELVSAQFEESQALLGSALATLEASRASYFEVIGHMPAALHISHRAEKKLPRSLEAALDIAFDINPEILKIYHEIEAQKHQVAAIRGRLLPSLTLNASVARELSGTSINRGGIKTQTFDWQDENSAAVSATLNVPIFQGGLVHSQVRQAKHLQQQKEFQQQAIRQNVRQRVVQAWGNWRAAQHLVTASEAKTRAEATSLEVKQQQKDKGVLRQLDIIEARRALEQAQKAVVDSQYNRVMASFQLLAALGRLTPEQLELAVTLHDPKKHYDAVKSRWFGTTPAGDNTRE